jgi:hypothetical protein
VTVRLEVAVVSRRTRLVELVATYVCKLHEAGLAANVDGARRDFPAQLSCAASTLCLARRIADRLPPCAIIRLP